MKNIFDTPTYNEIVYRINQLTEGSQRQWGKMNVAQMLAHCNEAYKVPLSDKPYPRMFMGVLMAWMFKNKMYNDEPWKQGLPTSPDFLIKTEKAFNEERTKLLLLMHQLIQAGAEKAARFPHPFFGRFTAEQWGKLMYKHLDHHLKQFGA